ncbi:MAG: hypothetical protein JSS70_05425 [Bacteroidetes bacterium]|nr:hypothetical protein [Bacteroidota bacterium]
MLLKDATEVQDIVQECFIHLWNRRDITPAIYKAYLYKTVYNAIVNYLIKKETASKPITPLFIAELLYITSTLNF